ncbi:citrate lyase subunit beta / citryl-CoA lyase [Arthrobacter sp. 31Cvi3.1E]|nr:citrate lyase subunit beta / citryl-CoA lyase [Arthrobacter sp. 31Cvi3.1E]
MPTSPNTASAAGERERGNRMRRDLSLPPGLSRSWLLVSAAEPVGFGTAFASSADSVIFDLEDSVLPKDKPQARRSVTDSLSSGPSAWVRINGPETCDWAEDLSALTGAPGLEGIMLAMTESADAVSATVAALPARIPVIALIETAKGIENAALIASAPGILRLAFGVGDFRLDTGTAGTQEALGYARSRLVVASRAAGLPGPIDGPSPDASREQLVEACRLSADLGMTGKLCLSPTTTELINHALSPTDAERQWATDLLAAQEGGSEPQDGSYRPKLRRAEKILALAKTYSHHG